MAVNPFFKLRLHKFGVHNRKGPRQLARVVAIALPLRGCYDAMNDRRTGVAVVKDVVEHACQRSDEH